MQTTYNQPIVSPLYLTENSATFTSSNAETELEKTHSSAVELPAELLSLCLASYASWGDLAKLATVRKSWSNIVMDTAEQSSQSKWELAQALMHGDCGLQARPEKAIQILKELAVDVEINDGVGRLVTIECVKNRKYDVYFTLAVKKLAECYLNGTGVKQDSIAGLAWMEAAFWYGNDAEAAHETALIYEYGRHNIAVDVVAAAHWFLRAALQGHVEAMAELGLCYELGCGVEQSDEQALDWYTKAANLGHATAKYSVGEIFEEARGVPQSDEEACLWYYRAALVGDHDSKVALRRLYDIARIVVPGVADILDE